MRKAKSAKHPRRLHASQPVEHRCKPESQPRTDSQFNRRDAMSAEIPGRESSLRPSRLRGLIGAPNVQDCIIYIPTSAVTFPSITFAVYAGLRGAYPAAMKPNQLTHEIIGAAIEVHRELG